MMSPVETPWVVLLIGGSSGVGKTNVARQLAKRLGTGWLQVDDLRLAFQRSQVILPEKTEALYFFQETPQVWNLPSEQLRDALVALGQVMSPALEVVIENHVDTADPVMIEGDAILPSLMRRPSVIARASNGRVRAVFLVEPVACEAVHCDLHICLHQTTGIRDLIRTAGSPAILAVTAPIMPFLFIYVSFSC